ncbi:MAG: hypothetical protein OHK0022_56830 [Roseiflexaceae bacterium]
MAWSLFEGQSFTIRNMDHFVLSDDWTILSIDPPRVVFSNTKRFVVEIAYVKHEETLTVEGLIVGETAGGVVVDLQRHSFHTVEVGLLVAGSTADYLTSLDPLEYA